MTNKGHTYLNEYTHLFFINKLHYNLNIYKDKATSYIKYFIVLYFNANQYAHR